MIIVALLTFCSSGYAYYYTVVGPEAYFNSDWDRTDATNRMEVLNNKKFYLIKEVTTTEPNTVIEFLVNRSNTAGHYINYTTNGNNAIAKASVTIAKADTYNLVFTFDSKNGNSATEVIENTLDVIVMAKVSADSHNSPSLWIAGDMTFNKKDNKFHYIVDVPNQSANFTGEYTVQAYHGRDNSLHEYNAGGSTPLTLDYTPAQPGNYEVDFIFDPIMQTVETPVVKRYYDYTIGATGYMTFSAAENLEVSEDVTAYYITGQASGSPLMNAVTTTLVPATTAVPQTTNGTGVIVRGAAGSVARFYSTSTSVTLTNNKLQGTGGSPLPVAANETYCFTKNGDGPIGFYLAEAGTYAANKAFLPASAVSRGRNFGSREYLPISFDGDELSGISDVRGGQAADGRCYNLQGQPVSRPGKGIYIINGKKFIHHN